METKNQTQVTQGTNVVPDSKQSSPNVTPQAADTPPVALTPEQVVEGLRALRAQMPSVDPLTDRERALARTFSRIGGPAPAVQASINAIGASEEMAPAVGVPADEAQTMVEETNRWTVVEAELKRFLSGVSDANLIRKQRTGIIAAKAYGIAKQIARDNPELRTHVKEIQRLRTAGRRKKAAPAPEAPKSSTTAPESPSQTPSAEPKQ
jgi:hypothetical protein